MYISLSLTTRAHLNFDYSLSHMLSIFLMISLAHCHRRSDNACDAD